MRKKLLIIGLLVSLVVMFALPANIFGIVSSCPYLSIEKVADKDVATIGEPVTYTITIEWHGNLDLENVTLEDPMLGINEDIGTLQGNNNHPGGTTWTKDYIYEVQESDIGTTITNTATVTGYNINWNPAQKSDTEELTVPHPSELLVVTKEADVDIVIPGDTITYTITVTWNGYLDLKDVTLYDSLLSLNVDCGTLSYMEKFEDDYTYIVQPGDIGILENMASAVGHNCNWNPAYNYATEAVTVNAAPSGGGGGGAPSAVISVLGISEEVLAPVWIRNHELTCYQVWVNEDNEFEFVFWWEYFNNNWVKIYDMAGNEVFSIDMKYGDANFTADLPDGMYTVKTFHEEGKILQEFVIGKP